MNKSFRITVFDLIIQIIICIKDKMSKLFPIKSIKWIEMRFNDENIYQLNLQDENKKSLLICIF